MNTLLRMFRKMGMVTGYALFKADVWVERVLVGVAISAMTILFVVIAWGIALKQR